MLSLITRLPSTSIPSISSNICFESSPVLYPPKPPSVRSDLTVLWHGMMIGKGFLAKSLPTALYALGLSINFAKEAYVLIFPFLILNCVVRTSL
ncbi:MAG: hypothetical protein MJ209_03645 [archaeon]|nr:hypothetical protein [archaeon]